MVDGNPLDPEAKAEAEAGANPEPHPDARPVAEPVPRPVVEAAAVSKPASPPDGVATHRPATPMVLDPGAQAILERLRGAGHEAYLCGGSVRDWLMGRSPKDWDIATNATPNRTEALFERTIPVGKSFGVMIVLQGGREYEVATFRAEEGYADGRRPDRVTFSSAEEDVRRRDFTLNALLYDPLDDRLLDSVGGVADIRAGILRTVGDPEARFLEDHLRLLRAVRFAARTGFALEPATAAAIREMAGLAITVSAERIGQELTRMLSEGDGARALRLLEESNLLLHLLPEVARLRGCPQPKRFHPEGDVLTHTVLMLELLDPTLQASLPLAEDADWLDREAAAAVLAEGARIDAATDHAPDAVHEGETPGAVRFPTATAREIMAWSVLLHDIGKPPTISYSDRIRFNCHAEESATLAEAILRRWKRPNRVLEAVAKVVGWHMKFANFRSMRKAKLRRVLADPLFPYHLELHRVDCASSHRMLGTHAFALERWMEERARPPEPARLLSGNDLAAMGYEPGPRMGRILAALKDAQLDEEVTDADAARAWVLHQFPLAGRR